MFSEIQMHLQRNNLTPATNDIKKAKTTSNCFKNVNFVIFYGSMEYNCNNLQSERNGN